MILHSFSPAKLRSPVLEDLDGTPPVSSARPPKWDGLEDEVVTAREMDHLSRYQGPGLELLDLSDLKITWFGHW